MEAPKKRSKKTPEEVANGDVAGGVARDAAKASVEPLTKAAEEIADTVRGAATKLKIEKGEDEGSHVVTYSMPSGSRLANSLALGSR